MVLRFLGEVVEELMPQHKDLRSSVIASVDYVAGTLTVNMQNGRSYTYSGVDHATYEALINAPSPGSFYNANIKNRL